MNQHPDQPDQPDQAQTTPETEAQPDPEPQPEPDPGTSIYVRRSRTPTLGFWVVLAAVLPALAGIAIGPFVGLRDLGGIFNFSMLLVFVVGLPLATIATAVDAYRHRRR